jgi:hypothetical protein
VKKYIHEKEFITVPIKSILGRRISVKFNKYMEVNMKKLVLVILILAIIGGGIYAAGTYYFVNTSDGIKIYPKSEFTLSKTYVNMNNMSFVELRHYVDLVGVMAEQGDLEYVPGGETLEKLAGMGESVADAVTKFDSEYQISNSLNEIERIGLDKWEAANNQYDISGKAEQAADYIQNAANQLNNWLKSK